MQALARSTDRPPLLGVLGGMGPHATVDFLNKLLSVTVASCDQDHLPVIVYSLPQIPDRSAAILAGGPSPLPALREAVRVLERADAKCIALPCNTAHYWFEELSSSTAVPLIHIVDAVIADLEARDVSGKVALLGTEATMRSDIYHARLNDAGFELLVPDANRQRLVARVIRKIKAGSLPDVDGALDELMSSLIRSGATACILGCTELPLMRFRAVDMALIDSTLALAKACVSLLHPERLLPQSGCQNGFKESS